MCTWSEKGSMTNEILTKILETLDQLEFFDRSTGIKLFLVLDGHGNMMVGLPFLRYINNPAHLWVACIGVHHGTSLWQVGDSAEQNGTYKRVNNDEEENNSAQDKADDASNYH